MPKFVKPQSLAKFVGRNLEPSEWLEITQERIDRFADATNDHQFIHVDAERAASSPFGCTIAHGYLTQSLITDLASQHAVVPDGTEMTINYGSDKVRFLAPVPVGKRIRARQKLLDVIEKRAGQWLCKNEVTIEIEHSDKPALVAEILLVHVVGS